MSHQWTLEAIPGPPQALLPAEPSLQRTHGIFSGLFVELAVIFFLLT